MSFWTTLQKPIIGLAPMDGITDPAFREIVDLYGKPDVIFTEFVPAEGIIRGVNGQLNSLKRHRSKTPQIAQFFGIHPKSFYKAAFVALEAGYDGIDINMGCPDRNIKKKGGGGGLISQPILAQEIIRSVKLAVSDWSQGKTIKQAFISDEVVQWIKDQKVQVARRRVPVSVKTRTGLDHHITEEWLKYIIEACPDCITLHGRTLTQMYQGEADWNEIAKACVLVKKNNITFIGNGDIKSKTQALEFAHKYGVDGLLIGRASLGNPWVFSGRNPDTHERRNVIFEHCEKYLKYRPDLKIFPMRKHLAWYCTGFDGSRALRNRLMQASSMDEIKILLQSLPA